MSGPQGPDPTQPWQGQGQDQPAGDSAEQPTTVTPGYQPPAAPPSGAPDQPPAQAPARWPPPAHTQHQ